MSIPNDKYFSFKGMAFRTVGDDDECALNTEIAMSKVRAYVMEGGCSKDAMEALAYLEDKFPKLEPCLDLMRIAFLPEEEIDEPSRNRIARKGYNCLADKLSGRPWAG
ncbi:MAG: hypothetical protein JWO78_225 [Micavibrio sp.]|nr:hypothetical protein [Micavibrio sp.]